MYVPSRWLLPRSENANLIMKFQPVSKQSRCRLDGQHHSGHQTVSQQQTKNHFGEIKIKNAKTGQPVTGVKSFTFAFGSVYSESDCMGWDMGGVALVQKQLHIYPYPK